MFCRTHSTLDHTDLDGERVHQSAHKPGERGSPRERETDLLRARHPMSKQTDNHHTRKTTNKEKHARSTESCRNCFPLRSLKHLLNIIIPQAHPPGLPLLRTLLASLRLKCSSNGVLRDLLAPTIAQKRKKEKEVSLNAGHSSKRWNPSHPRVPHPHPTSPKQA